MFERNRVDTVSERQTVLVPAEVTLNGGELLAGKFVVAGGRALFTMLNGPDMFVEFEPYGEPRRFIAKANLRAVTPTPVPPVGHLKERIREIDGFDPAGILGLEHGASLDEARTAYHRMARKYHPDRYASVELPPEVASYMAAVARRLNSAFAAIEHEDAARRRRMEAAAKPSEPVYTSNPRF